MSEVKLEKTRKVLILGSQIKFINRTMKVFFINIYFQKRKETIEIQPEKDGYVPIDMITGFFDLFTLKSKNHLSKKISLERLMMRKN